MQLTTSVSPRSALKNKKDIGL